MTEQDKILKGRQLVELYREKRKNTSKNKLIYDELTTSLKDLGFDSVDDFFKRNGEFNIGIFSSIYKVTGKCTHDCHGTRRGCLESWYKRRMVDTNNELNGTLANTKEAYSAWLVNKKGTPPACSYKLVKTGDTKIDIRWK